MRVTAFAAATLLVLVAHQAGARSTGIYAPLDRPGPNLSVATASLNASLRCEGDMGGPLEPVLLVPGTASTPETAFSWNYERAFRMQARAFCTVTLPGYALLDIQTNGEYVVHAIRKMFALDGQRRIGIVGWSQGGMVPRWALRFWPDTRRMVADLIGLDPSNHGTVDAVAACLATSACPPAVWQQATNSNFLQALNSGTETFAGVAYTTVYSRTDEIVVPNETAQGSSSLQTGKGARVNVAVQDICPTDTSEHFAMGTYDPVGYALAIDALGNSGPANPSLVPLTVCLQGVQPGVDPATLAQNSANLLASAGAAVAAAPKTSSEPPLAPYVFK